MQGTLEAVHAQLLYRIRMTGQSLSARDISDIFGNLWMKIESTFIDIDEDALEEGWTFAVERVYEAAQNNPGSLVRSLLRERVASLKKSSPKKITTKTSAGIPTLESYSPPSATFWTQAMAAEFYSENGPGASYQA